MTSRRIVSGFFAIAAAAVLGVSITAASSASARTAAPTARTAAPTARTAAQKPKHNVVVLNCLGKPQVEPKSFVLACADGNSYLTGLSWTSWTPKLASATGALVQNDCRPNCVGGHFHRYPVLAVLWGPVRYAHDQRYNELTLIFPGARPLVYNGHQWVPGPQTITSPLWAA